MSTDKFLNKLTESDTFKFFFEKVCQKGTVDTTTLRSLEEKITELTTIKDKIKNDIQLELTKSAAAAGVTGTVKNLQEDAKSKVISDIITSAQKKARNEFILYFIIFLILAFGFIFWTFIITARIKDNNKTFGIKEGNTYLIYAISIFWYSILYLVLGLWLIRKRTCNVSSLYLTIGGVLTVSVLFIWMASQLIGIMQNHGKDCVVLPTDPKSCDITKGELDSVDLIFSLTLTTLVIIVLITAYWIYGIVKNSKKVTTTNDNKQ